MGKIVLYLGSHPFLIAIGISPTYSFQTFQVFFLSNLILSPIFQLCLFFSFIPMQAFVELYDIKKDPDQLKNIVKEVSPKFLAKKHSRLADLATCSGDSCREAY